MGLLAAHKALADKIAVVLGGCAGHIGRGVTLGLLGEGVNVIACDNDREGIEAILAEAEALPGTLIAHFADVSNEASLNTFFDIVESECERVDILINVPGGVERASFEETARASHARDIRLNYDYVIQSCHRAISLLKRSGAGGTVINFTTIEAHRGAATFAVYAGAKAAVTNFSRALAVELGASQIRVNCIATDTSPARASNGALSKQDFERLAELGDDALAKAIEFYVPQKQPPLVKDVVNGVLFLASDLSRTITGQTLHVDGGTSASWGFLDWPGGDGYMPAPLGGSLKKLLS